MGIHRQYVKLSLQELLHLVKDSDRCAFDELYGRTWKNLYIQSLNKLRNEDLAKDVVQEVFIDLWNKRSSRDIHNIEQYLAQAVKFKVIDQFRKKDFFVAEIEDFVDVIADSNLSDNSLLDKELNELLERWISQLPRKRREIFLLRHEQGMSTHEISKLLNISAKTVQNQLLNTISFLRGMIQKTLFIFFLFFFGS